MSGKPVAEQEIDLLLQEVVCRNINVTDVNFITLFW
jgi:hypothetical protein